MTAYQLMKFPAAILILCGLAACDGSDLSSRQAESTSLAAGSLQLVPEKPRVGDSVQVRYRPIAALENEGRLVLRARFRTPQDPAYNKTTGSRRAAELVPGAAGVFTGRFELPPGVVFAAFAVENPSADRIDTHGGEFPELVVHDGQGRPLFDALEQRLSDHMGRDAREVLASARAMTEHYPELPESWRTLRFAEGLAPDGRSGEARAGAHRERLRALDAELRSADVDADTAGDMYWYARGLDASIRDFWLERLQDIDPDHFFLVQNLVIAMFDDDSITPETRLAELEAMWNRIEDRHARETMASMGTFAAREAGDGQVMQRWARRAVEYSRGQPPDYTVMAVAAYPPSRGMGIDWLRSMIAELSSVPEGERPLGVTQAEYERQLDTRIASLQTALGKALLAEDRPEQAVAALEAAITVGWNTDRFEALAKARRAAGDHDGAARALAAVAADPMQPEQALPEWLSDYEPQWSGIVARAEVDMLERTLAEADSRPLDEARVENRSGERVAVQNLFGPEATVVVFWSRYCGPSSRAMPDIAALAQTLSAQGVPLLAVTDDPSEAAMEFVESQALDVKVLFDALGEAKLAFNAWATPQYFVLDGDGRLRFTYTRLDDLMRQVAALKRGVGG